MFWNKPKIIYGDFLKGHRDVVKKKPALVKQLAEDIDLELYIGDSSMGENTWATAVISVKDGNKIFKNKYESGRLKNDLEKMAQECIFHIKNSWGLDHFRKFKGKL